MASQLFPVLLSGGAGVRLWPVSREDEPKPFIKVADNQSLLQKTYLRAMSIPHVETILTVTNQEYFFRTHDEYNELTENNQSPKSIHNKFLLEPKGRNTTPAIALAAFMLREQYGEDAIMLVLSADHLIENSEEFLSAVDNARKMAEDGHLVTFGITPTRPENGYGYIKCGASISGTEGFKVEQFVEKPSTELAEKYIQSGRYYWNAGIFCLQVSKILSELQMLCPDVYDAALATWKATSNNASSKDIYYIDAKTFAQVPSISLDYAVMEKSKIVTVVPSKFEWSDIGSWESMCNFVPPDKLNNRIDGKAILVDTKNTYVQSRTRMVAAVGVEDLIIVDTDDAVLISHRHKTQDVRKVVEQLRLTDDDVYKIHKTVVRPWGTYKVLEESKNSKIRRIVIKSQVTFSSQTHNLRSSYWTVVSGMAKVTCNNQAHVIYANESVFCPIGQMHHVENIGSMPVVLLEIQTDEQVSKGGVEHFEEYNRKENIINLKEEKKNVV